MSPAVRIGQWLRETKAAYKVLQKAGVTEDKKVKKLDENSDNKGSDDELVSLDFEDDEETNETNNENSNSSSTQMDSSVMDQIRRYDEANLQLETQLNQLYSQMSTAADFEEMQSYQSSID